MEHTILVVGHRTGIGHALTQTLLESGYKVLGISRDKTDFEHENLTSLEMDIESIELDDIPSALSGFVFCPGSINLKPFKSMKSEDFNHDFQVNAFNAAKALQKAEKSLIAGKGSVVLFSTVAVGQGMPFHSSVAMAKGAIEGLGRSLAAEWAPNVRVNIIAPSLTDTPMAKKLLGNENRRIASEQRHPLKSVGNPIEIAQMAMLLLESKWISGETIGINGGMGHIRN
ncbi:MAG: 3-oxoacyl-[acyl-carrier-protein] reductase FabG1 [Owenweeksia sp. TMED14]|nr:MAG: 3-oxoacyl-[acyl-carrier-protein] reductase FabG1 [Owenweeksia sp. TMED14]|tara:strand:+ start:662 stop:1345 length:684 start_codon:yes stop_codon:yes gene_type:complete